MKFDNPVDKIRFVFNTLYGINCWYKLSYLIHQLTPTNSAGNKVRLGDESHTLAAILGQSARRSIKDNLEWFSYSTREAELDTNFKKDRLEDHMEILVSLNLIQKRRAPKAGGERQLKINFDLFVELLSDATFQLRGYPASEEGLPRISNSKLITKELGVEKREEAGSRSPTAPVPSPSSKTSQKRANFPEKSLPSFCKEQGERLLKILQSRRPQVAVEPGTVTSRTKHIHTLWTRLGKDDPAKERIIAVVDKLEENINYLPKPTLTSILKFTKVFDWVVEEMDKLDSPKDEDGRKIGKIYWNTLDIEEWVDEVLPNGRERSTLKKFKVKKSFKWEITQGDNGKPEFNQIWIDNPRTVSNDW